MAIIYDFVKYKSDKEIEVYENSLATDAPCFACPDCSSRAFIIFLDQIIQCADCEVLISLEFEQ